MPFPAGFAATPQEPVRIGLGLVALAFYLWVIHSYKLPAGDIAVLSLGVGVLIRGGTVRVPGPLLFFAAFIAWSAVGLGVTDRSAVTMNVLVELVKLWILTFCIFNIIRNPAELRFLTIVWLAVFALYPVRGALYNHFICGCSPFGRVAWNFMFSNPNDMAALSLVPLGAAAGLAAVERVKLWRYAAFAGVAVLALVVMLTQSRGAMIGMGVAAILLPLTSRRRSRDLMLLVLVVGAAALVAPRDVWTRLAGLGNASVGNRMQGVDPEGSAEARWQIWSIAGEAVQEYPVTGVGLGMMPERNRLVALRRGLGPSVLGARDTHSTYLRIAAETGIPGLVLYLLIWAAVIVKLRRAKSMIRAVRPADHQFLVFIELSVFAFLAASLFGSYGTISFTYLIIAFVWLASEILSRERWYVPPDVARAGEPVPAVSRRRR
jgi:O-antigen ligase